VWRWRSGGAVNEVDGGERERQAVNWKAAGRASLNKPRTKRSCGSAVLPIRSLGFTGTFGNELIFAVSVPRGRAFPLARVRVPYVHTCVCMCVPSYRAPDTEVEVCGHNRRRVISDPSVNTRLAPRGRTHTTLSSLSHISLPPPPLSSLSCKRWCTCMYVVADACASARERESESCYDMHTDQIALCVLCIPDDCALEIRFFCLRRPHSPFLRGDPACFDHMRRFA